MPTYHSKRQPNIVLIISDDHDIHDAGCYGHPSIRTPGLDELAANGVRMSHAYCSSPSCSASRSTIYTGLHNHANGQYGHSQYPFNFHTFDHIQSLPSLFNAAGYRTALYGKCHVEPMSVYPFQTIINKDYTGDITTPVGLADACKATIDSHEDSPFCLVYALREPHRPYFLHEKSRWKPEDVTVHDFLPDTPECRVELAEYYASVEQCDTGIVRLIEILKESGHWDDTLVMYISDNGIAFPGAKTNLYDPGIRLPMIIRNPFMQNTGHQCNAMVSFADILPTFLDFAHITVPADITFHGHSFLHAIEEENPDNWNEVYASHSFHETQMYYPMRGIRERQYKLIWNIAHPLTFPSAADLYISKTWQGLLKNNATHLGPRSIEAYLHRPKWELFDLQKDPDEVHNLAEEPEYAEELYRLKRKIENFMTSTNDLWKTKLLYE